MVDVGYGTDGGAASAENHSRFTGRHSDDSILAVTGHQLCVGTGAADHLGTLAGTELDVVDDGAEGDFTERQAVSEVRRHTGTGNNLLADLQSVRSHNVAFLTVSIEQQSNTGRTVRVVFNGVHGCRNAVFVSTEVNNTIHLLMTATAVTHRHLTTIISTTRAGSGHQ